ncbi:MAG: flagellar protein FlaG [Syntrophales bacterium]|nr:flagellar protein FlaG [Syntrophales bacterium]
MDINGVSDMKASAAYDVQTAPAVHQPARTVPQYLTQKGTDIANQAAMDKEQMKRMVEDIQRNLSNMNVGLEFSTYGKNNDQISIVVVEKDSGKVIREIPSKEIQSLYTKMSEIAGLLLHNRA